MGTTLPESLEAALREGVFGEESPLAEIDVRLDRYFSGDDGVTRASLINLAIYTENPVTMPDDDRSLLRISRNHACRALLLGVAPGEGGLSVRCWIKARCHLGPSGKGKLCSEQVTFLLGGDCQSCLTNLVFSHVRSDLPLVMWWRGELSRHFQENLYALIDRLILDSSRWPDPVPQFARVRQALASRTARLADRRGQLLVHDLAYTRGHQHRRAVATLFDPPEARETLVDLERVMVGHGPGHRHTALYLAAWITGQLDAELVARDGDAFRYRRENAGELAVDLVETEGRGPIPSIVFEGRGARLEVISSGSSPLLRIRRRCGDRQTSAYLPGPSEEDEQLVSEILMRGGSNVLLAKVLPRMEAMLG